ncbi:hypothetical protein DFJ77DRAFT_126139 [Powellomyces hirtus]|nr:hypothetical protein DFJ77DRAFT_126139 [Powellomyces hirtus]
MSPYTPDGCSSTGPSPVSRLLTHLTDHSSVPIPHDTSSSSTPAFPLAGRLRTGGKSNGTHGWGTAYEEFLGGSSKSAGNGGHSQYEQEAQPNSSPVLQMLPLEPYRDSGLEDDEFSSEWSDEAFTARYLSANAPSSHPHSTRPPPRTETSNRSKPPFPVGLGPTSETHPWASEFSAFVDTLGDAELFYLDALGKRSDWNWAKVFQAPPTENGQDTSSEEARAVLAEVSKRRLQMLLAQLSGHAEYQTLSATKGS